jgi:hypothetical protein
MLRTDIESTLETLRWGFHDHGAAFDFAAAGLDRDQALFAVLFAIHDDLQELLTRERAK